MPDNQYVQVVLEDASASLKIFPFKRLIRIGRAQRAQVEGTVVEPFTIGAAQEHAYAILHLVKFRVGLGFS